MPIHTPGAPSPDLHAIVARHLNNPFGAPRPSPVQRGQVSATDAYPVYVLGLDELAAVETLAPASPRHWRHLLVHESGTLAEVDLTADDAPRVLAVHQGPRGPGTARALEAAQASELVQGADFELRMLEVPAIYLVAVWLHGADLDLLIAAEPDRSGLPLYEPVRLERALPVLRRRAAQVREAHEQAPGPSGA